jgi:O-antigen ligase
MSRTAPTRTVPATQVNRVVLAAFYLMVFSFNFEMPDRGGWEIPAMTAALFIASTPLAFRVCYGHVPGALWWFAGFLWVYLVSSLVHGWVDFGDVRHYFIVLVEAAIVCWASVNLFSREGIGTTALWCFVFSALARSVLPMLGVGRTSYAVWTGGERMTAFGQNANFSAILLSAGLVTLLGLTYGRRGASRTMRLLAWPIGAFIGAAIIETGSRGGLLALAGGLVALVFTAGGNLKARLRNGLVTVLALGLFTYAAFTATVMKNRLEATAETGTLAGREQLWPSLVEMALEKPWGGWGPINNQYEVASRTTDMAKEHRDAHNLLLELMTAEGLAGTVPFLIGLGMCVVAAWRGRTSPYGIVPFALVALFLAANVSTNLAAYKPFWWVLALALGSGSLAAQQATAGGTRPCAV